MVIGTDAYVIVSQNEHRVRRETGFCLDWTPINYFYYTPGQRRGEGVEPHYHDLDEFWLFGVGGIGEGWLDGERFDVTPNTIVYTPTGVVHRFQIFRDFETVAVATVYEGQQRAGHLLVAEAGPPERTVPGFVVDGAENSGPFADPGPRCPLSELRLIRFAAGEEVSEARLQSNEHWLVVAGTLRLDVEGLQVELCQGDVALLRGGTVRRIRCDKGGRAALAREG